MRYLDRKKIAFFVYSNISNEAQGPTSLQATIADDGSKSRLNSLIKMRRIKQNIIKSP